MLEIIRCKEGKKIIHYEEALETLKKNTVALPVDGGWFQSTGIFNVIIMLPR